MGKANSLDSARISRPDVATVIRDHFLREFGGIPRTFGEFQFRVERDVRVYKGPHIISVGWRYAGGPWTLREFLPPLDEPDTLGMYVSIFRWLINEIEPHVLLLREVEK